MLTRHPNFPWNATQIMERRCFDTATRPQHPALIPPRRRDDRPFGMIDGRLSDIAMTASTAHPARSPK